MQVLLSDTVPGIKVSANKEESLDSPCLLVLQKGYKVKGAWRESQYVVSQSVLWQCAVSQKSARTTSI
jgi:hypothetical protein